VKISVSNIAWENKELEEHLSLLKELGCDGVEIAPSCIWAEPVDTSHKDITELKKLISSYGLEIPAFHALLFTRPDLYLFGERTARDQAIEYLKKMIRLAGDLSVKALVFGSPKSRDIRNKSFDECYKIAVDVFAQLADQASEHDTCLCIEPLSKDTSNFINTSDQGNRLVEDVGRNGFGLHLDSSAMAAGDEDFEGVFSRLGGTLRHFHVNDHKLTPPGSSGSIDHSRIGSALSKSDYRGFISVEMRRGFGPSIEVIKKAVSFVTDNYKIPSKVI